GGVMPRIYADHAPSALVPPLVWSSNSTSSGDPSSAPVGAVSSEGGQRTGPYSGVRPTPPAWRLHSVAFSGSPHASYSVTSRPAACRSRDGGTFGPDRNLAYAFSRSG